MRHWTKQVLYETFSMNESRVSDFAKAYTDDTVDDRKSADIQRCISSPFPYENNTH